MIEWNLLAKVPSPVWQSILMVAAGAVGWFARRWITRAQHKEEADSLLQYLDIHDRLKASGISLVELRGLRDRFRTGREIITPAITATLLTNRDAGSAPEDLANLGNTTAEIRFGLSDRLAKINAELEDALVDLAESDTASRAAELIAAQKAWADYRDKDALFESLLMEGGTGASVLHAARLVELTEARLDQVKKSRAKIAAQNM